MQSSTTASMRPSVWNPAQWRQKRRISAPFDPALQVCRRTNCYRSEKVVQVRRLLITVGVLKGIETHEYRVASRLEPPANMWRPGPQRGNRDQCRHWHWHNGRQLPHGWRNDPGLRWRGICIKRDDRKGQGAPAFQTGATAKDQIPFTYQASCAFFSATKTYTAEQITG